ncbi:6-phosphogluconolactonase [Irineochytrium annulatum]|nr:6-phosphogluconolactonase [Irineochytrium annulatum]
MSNITILPNADAISSALDARVSAASASAIQRTGRFTVAISGGSLPSQLGANIKHNNSVDWSKWHVWLADERCVPHDHPDSNYLLIKNNLLDHVPIPAEQVHPIGAQLVNDPAAAAQDYQNQLRALFGDGGVPVFDLILLGMGPDGHTCSLFPGHALLQEHSLWVAPITDSPKPPPCRITLTYPVLNAADNVWMVTTGRAKAEVLHAILDEGAALPSGLVKPRKPMHWIVDTEAATLLSASVKM